MQDPKNADTKLIRDYLIGSLRAGERAAFERRLAAEPALARELAFMRRICSHYEASDGTAGALPDEWGAALRRRMSSMRIVRPGPPPTLLSAWRVAAAVMVAVGVSIAGYLAVSRSILATSGAPSTIRTVATSRAQRMSLRLPDGSDVTLAPASTLRFASTFGTHDRALELIGQAAFDVVHDERRPFVVRAGNVVARDLGTEFVIRAYPDDSVADVVVAEGAVAVATATNTADSVVLTPGDRAEIASHASIAVTHDVPLDSYFGWTDGRLSFHRTPLGDVARQIGRWHDVEIRLASPELAQRGFTGSFRPTQSAREVLHALATTLDLHVIQAGPYGYIVRGR